MEEMRKGQIFMIGALIFSSLLVLVFLSFGEIIQSSPEPVIRNYFEDSQEKSVHAFNEIQEENRSVQHIKTNLYGHNRFLLLRSRAKGIEYESINFFIIPEKRKAVFINYRETSTDAYIKIGDTWDNFTVQGKQFNEIGFDERNPDVRLIIDNPSIDRSLTAYTPRFFNWMKMNSENEKWNNNILR